MSAIIIEVSDDWGMIIPTITADMHRALSLPQTQCIEMSCHFIFYPQDTPTRWPLLQRRKLRLREKTLSKVAQPVRDGTGMGTQASGLRPLLT